MQGGPREGAGRPVGKVNIIRKKILEFFNEEDIRNLVEEAKKQALEKPELLKFLLEQIFGKAPQRLEMTGEDGGKIIIEIAREVAIKNGLNTSTSDNNE